jgi:alpha-1,6-mannosyltransferase
MSTQAPDATGEFALEPDLLERLRDARPVAAPRRPRLASRTRTVLAGTLALATLALCSLLTVAAASGQKTILVPQSPVAFPDWLAGPLHLLTRQFAIRSTPTAYAFSAVLLAMTVAYGVAVACAPALGRRVVAGAIVVLHAIWLLAPLMPLTDVFNYLGYARLGTLHGLNPYVHGIAAAPHDAIVPLTTWRYLHSPYGPLFTLASYGLGPLPLPLAYWLLKLATVAGSLACIALLWRCAEQLGRPPLRPVLLYAANPLVLAYGLGGFHNDVFVLLLSLAAISLLLERREGRAGAAIAAAIAIKASAGVLLPFLLLGSRRRGRLLAGLSAIALPVAAASFAVFGTALPDLGDQSSLLSSFSVPDALAQVTRLGGAPSWLLALAAVLAAGAVALLALHTWRRRIDWLTGAGWATLALLLSLAWLQPWYVMWLLPLAALGASARLRRATLVLSAYLLITFMPATGVLLANLHYQPLDGAVGCASVKRMHALQWGPRSRSARISPPCGSTRFEAPSRSIATTRS